MIEHAATYEEFRDVEEMVRAAGDYLEVTEDLRPQTVERARNESRKTSTRSQITVVAVIVVFLGISTGVLRGRLSSTPPLLAGAGAGGDQLYAAALSEAARANVDPTWSLVDAFRELRQRQANLVEEAF